MFIILIEFAEFSLNTSDLLFARHIQCVDQLLDRDRSQLRGRHGDFKRYEPQNGVAYPAQIPILFSPPPPQYPVDSIINVEQHQHSCCCSCFESRDPDEDYREPCVLGHFGKLGPHGKHAVKCPDSSAACER